MPNNNYTGKVILAGAGPGDPGLITVKALRYLQLADVLIVDRLVGEELINGNVKPGAKVIYVGKQDGQHSSVPQERINELIVEHAKQDNLIVRLKGGDVTFFSNVLDELTTLVKHDIPFEIVPGVTAASGAAAYAGIPLTARGYASAVRFLAYHRAVVWKESYWAELAATDDTLVFYMSSGGLDSIVAKLLDNGISPDKCLAIVEQATTPFQNVELHNLAAYNEKLQPSKFASPALMIIGKVTALHNQFQWFQSKGTGQLYFPSVDESIERQLSAAI